MCGQEAEQSFVVAVVVVGVFARLLFLSAYYYFVSTVYCCEGILILLCLAPILFFFSFLSSLSCLTSVFCLPAFVASLLSLGPVQSRLCPVAPPPSLAG